MVAGRDDRDAGAGGNASAGTLRRNESPKYRALISLVLHRSG